MIEVSENLQNAIEGSVKQVTPVVTARFADNRFLENLTISSTSNNYENLVLRKNPKLYWRFNEYGTITSTADLSGSGVSGTCTNITTIESPISRLGVYIEEFTDDFTRSNSAYEPGFLSGNPNVSWETNDKGLWGISSNLLYISEWDASNWEDAFANCFLDIGAYNGYIQYTFKTTPASASQHGVCLRYVDKDNFIGWKFVYAAGFHVPLFYTVVDGVYTSEPYVVKAMAVNGVVKIEFIDNQVIAYYNGVQFDDYTITDDIFLDESITKCGLAMHDSTGASLANARWGAVEAAGYNTLDRAFSFNGSTAYVSATNVSPINLREDFTLSFWFNNDDVSGTQYILREFSGSSDKFGAYLDGSELHVYLEDNASTRYDLTNMPMTADQWHFVALTKNGSALTLYVDGVESSTSVMQEYIKDLESGTLIAGAQNTTPDNSFDGYVDEIAIHDVALSAKFIEMMYGAALNTGTFIGAGAYFKDEQSANGVGEEAYSFGVTDSLNEYGSIISACGEYRVLPSEYNVNTEFGWWSRTKSDINGDFSTDEIMWAEFDNRYANKIILSTGFITSRIESVDYYAIKTDDTIVTDTAYFTYGESMLEIDIEEDQYKAFGLKMNSTWFGDSFGVINEINFVWDVDISEYVVSFSFDKVRDNYDSTLPIGLTSANSGSIVLDNTDRIFNPYGTSIYSSYMLPDVELFISLRYLTGLSSTEDIKVADNVFIDEWSVESSSMAVSGSFRDFSKYIQEETLPNGFLYLNSSAGRAIENIMKLIQYPARRIFSWDTYYNMMWKSRPWAMWRMSDTTSTIEDHGGRYDGTITGSGYTQGVSSIISQEYTALATQVYRGESSGVVNNTLDDNNRHTIYATEFDGTANTRVEVTSAELSMTNNWSLEAIVQPSDLPTNIGDRFAIIAKQDSSNNYNFLMFIEKTDTDSFIFGTEMTSASTTLYASESDAFASADIIDENFTLISVRDGSYIYISVNGEIYDVTDVGANACHTNSEPLTIGGLKYSVSGSRQEFIGTIGPVTMWNRPLLTTEISRHHTASLLSDIYIFPYLFSKDSTPWDAMLEIATADIGMFYFDEEGDFQYEYLYTLHESALSRHQEVQYELTDEENIIDGSQPINIQTNKIVVIVNPSKTVTNNYKSIWRAESGESLAVTTIAENMTASQTTVLVTDTEYPIWLKSGYFKVGDEIIFYGNRQNNLLIDLERGQFNTDQESHTSGDLCREARAYNVEYTGGPASGIKFPFLTAREFDGTADIDKFVTGPYVAEIVVSANDTNAEGDLVIIEGKNPVTELDNFFSIAGITFEETTSNQKITKEIREISESVRRFHTKEMTIDNQYIQEEAYAKKVADYIIRFFGIPTQIMTVSVSGLPQLQLSDLIEIVKFDQFNILNKRFWIISSSMNYDGGITHSLSLREYSEGL